MKGEQKVGKTWVFVLIFLLILALIGGVVFLFLREDEDKPITGGDPIDNTALQNLSNRVNSVETGLDAIETTVEDNELQLFSVSIDASQAKQDSSQAATDASQALTTANQTQSNLAGAIQDASQAATDASQAKQDSSQAATDASQALSTANQAQTNISQAVQDASQAATDASQAIGDSAQAQATANSALNTANQAQTDAVASINDSFQALSLAQNITGKVDALSGVKLTSQANALDLDTGSNVLFSGIEQFGTNPPFVVNNSVVNLPPGDGSQAKKYLVTYSMEAAAYPSGDASMHWLRSNVEIAGSRMFIFDTNSGTPGVSTEFGSAIGGAFQVEGSPTSGVTLQWQCRAKNSPNFRIRRPRAFITEIL